MYNKFEIACFRIIVPPTWDQLPGANEFMFFRNN